MHFINLISSEASISATITNVEVIEPNNALCQNNRIIEYLPEQLRISGQAVIRIDRSHNKMCNLQPNV